MASFKDLAVQPVSARPSLVTAIERLAISAKPFQHFVYIGRCVGNSADASHIPISPCLRNGNDNRVFMDVESDKKYAHGGHLLFKGCKPPEPAGYPL
jgi:hypothetical protein